jgi:lipopolysaccharide export system permease protein
MRVLSRYILKDYVVAFSMTLLIFTFVMCVGAAIKAIDLIARGVSPMIILRAFTYNIPYILTFSIPMSAMTTVLLLFGRLSLDGEITAMKAGGMSMWQIISPVVFASIVLSGVCVYLNVSLAPNAHYARRQALMNVGVADPISLLEEGRFVREFPGYMIYIGRKVGNEVTDVVVYETSDEGVDLSIRARTGTLSMPMEHLMQIDLYEVRIDQPDEQYPDDPGRTRTIVAQHYPVQLDFSRLMRRGSAIKGKSSMTLLELTATIRNIRDKYPRLGEHELRQARMGYLVEANERLALSLSCFAFTLLGIPLGMKSRRRESSIGVGISLGIVFAFYLFIIIADALVKHPHLHPDLIVWVPVIAGEVLGFMLIRRQD